MDYPHTVYLPQNSLSYIHCMCQSYLNEGVKQEKVSIINHINRRKEKKSHYYLRFYRKVFHEIQSLVLIKLLSKLILEEAL